MSYNLEQREYNFVVDDIFIFLEGWPPELISLAVFMVSLMVFSARPTELPESEAPDLRW
jgi:hypothetical protein